MLDPRGFTHLLCGRIHVREPGLGVDEAIARLAARQHGIAARWQLLELGIAARSIDQRLALGRLRRIYPGVYAVGHEAISPAGRALAAVMSCWPGAAASHQTATALHGLTAPPPLPHITARERRAPRRGLVAHRAALPDADLDVVEGVPVTSLPRAVLDLAGAWPEARILRLIKAAEYHNLVAVADLVVVLERHPRRRGRRRLVRVITPFIDDRRPTRSSLEDRFLAFCRRRRLPLPETNERLWIGGRLYKPDCLWRDARLIVELDGRDAHTRELAFAEDRARDRALIAAGWLPVRITSGQLAHDGDTLEAQIRGILARAGDPRGIDHREGG